MDGWQIGRSLESSDSICDRFTVSEIETMFPVNKEDLTNHVE